MSSQQSQTNSRGSESCSISPHEKEIIQGIAGIAQLCELRGRTLDDHEKRLRTLEVEVQNNKIMLGILKWASAVIMGAALTITVAAIWGVLTGQGG